MGVTDGSAVDAANTNPAFIDANQDDFTIGVVGLKKNAVASGGFINDIQREANNLAANVGLTTNQAIGSVPSFSNSQGFTNPAGVFTRANELSGQFNNSSGHAHDGALGGGAPIQSSSIAGVNLRGVAVKGSDIASPSGSSIDVSSLLTGQAPSTGSAIQGISVNAPYNKVILRQLSGVNANDQLVDALGNMVYGRLTFVTSVWTLSFYVDLAGTETAYTLSGAQTTAGIIWYYQQLFNPIVNSPVYSDLFFTPSENATADVVDASATQRGLVSTGTQSFGGNKTFTGSISASNLSGTNTGDVTLTTVGSSPNANAASLSGQVLTIQPANSTNPGVLTSGTQSIGGNKTFTGTIAASNLSGTNTGDVTLAAIGSSPNANGASLSGQVLTLQPASSTLGGVITAIAQSILGVKTFISGAISNTYFRLIDSGTNYVSIKAPTTVTTSYDLTLPVSSGSANQVLTTDGTGVTSWTTAAATGVTSISVTSANGLAGTSSGGSTPALTLSTTITGLLKGNGTAISAATSGTDYVIPSGSITGTASNVTGTVAIANGGTGQTTKTPAFNALSPIAAKADLITSNGTNNVALPVGTDAFVLTADSTQATGLKWASIGAKVKAFASQNTGQSIANATITKIIGNIVEKDASSIYNSTTGVFTQNKTGTGNFKAIIGVSLNGSASTLTSAVYKNGSLYKQTYLTNSGIANIYNATIDVATDGVTNDTWDFRVTQNTGATASVTTTSAFNQIVFELD